MNNIFEYIRQIISAVERPIVVEIGAAKCEDSSRIIQQLVAKGPYEYYAFEPDPRNIETIKRSKVNELLHLIPTAVGDADKRSTFHQSGGTNPSFGYEHTLSGSLKKPVEHLAAHPWCKFEKQTEVRVMKLDTFFTAFSLPYINFIWCDVQGAEDLVLAGGMNALAHTRFFYTEYYNNEMYEGQIPAEEIRNRLGTSWRIVEQWPGDILFENLCPRQKSV